MRLTLSWYWLCGSFCLRSSGFSEPYMLFSLLLSLKWNLCSCNSTKSCWCPWVCFVANTSFHLVFSSFFPYSKIVSTRSQKILELDINMLWPLAIWVLLITNIGKLGWVGLLLGWLVVWCVSSVAFFVCLLLGCFVLFCFYASHYQ